MSDIRLSEKILPSFYDYWRACDDPNILNVVAKGGRNSSKSTTTAVRLIFNRMKYRTHALVIRKVGNTLRKSCRQQLIWAINHLGVQPYWRYSPALSGEMTLTYKPTGASIFFSGADDPDKIKSLKTSDMPITEAWFEELSDFKTEEEVSTIKNSILREELPDGFFYKFYHTYNPPKRKGNWVNKTFETHNLPGNTFVHASNYLTNPYVAKQFIIEAEHIKATNSRRYEWEYLGKPIGSGVVPFDNLVFREITNEEIRTFDNIRQGLDFGYSIDPLAFCRWHYDKTRRTIYALDEIYEVKMSNREAAQEIRRRDYWHLDTLADSAEPKSIDEIKGYGVRIKPAAKGPGSVEFGEKWLDDLEAIVIDPKRTPKTAWEFENIDYQTDKDGKLKAKLEDEDNHLIDATRYAFSKDMKRTVGPVGKPQGY